MKIKFLPQNIEVENNPDKSLMEIAHENNIPIKSICNGKPSCAECRIRIVEGMNNVPPPGKEETNLIGTAFYLDGRRLSCQVHCYGNVVVDTTEQLNRTDTQKKIKGVRMKDQEITAKQDTMILTEDPKKNK